MKNIGNRFEEIMSRENILVQEPMSRHTTFRIGGPADYYLCPESPQEISGIIHICREENVPYFILGNGSNLLVSDKGYKGVVIQIFKNMNHVTVEGTKLTVQAGCLLSTAARKALDEGLTGMEFASGIPGTMGGAVFMNAGAYGGEMKDIVESVKAMDCDGNIFHIQAEDLEMGYRTSAVRKKGYIVLEAVLNLKKGEKEEILKEMERLKEQRVTKQPLDRPSAGSTFKRPEGYFAGKLIQDAGLRGYQVGGAQVSEKHCGFVINTGNATADDVLHLIRNVQKKILDQFGVKMETEVRFLGEFDEDK